MNSTQKYFHYLDFLRILAAFCVLLIHARCEVFNEYSLLNPSSQNLGTILFFSSVGFGLEGVMILFVISGFLVGGRNIKALSNGQITARSFIINRISRILPPLLGALVLSSFVKFIRGYDLSSWSILGNLMGLQLIAPGVRDEIGVLWTIPYEIWFYALILVTLLFWGKEKRYVLGVCILSISLCMFTMLEVQFFFIIILGTIGYFLRDYLPRGRKYLLFAFIGLFATKLIGVLSNSGRAFQGPLADLVNFKLLIFLEGFFIAMIILRLGVSQPSSKLQCWIDNIGRKCAPISYSLFLTHFSVLELFQFYLGRRADVDSISIGLFFIESVVCVIVAFMFYFIIEKNTKLIESRLTSFVEKILK